MNTILIVDDYPEVVVAYKMTLEMGIPGATIITAKNEIEAFEIIKSENAIDVVITDLTMIDDMSGIRVLEMAKEKDSLVMVIIITAFEKKIK